MKIFYIMKSDLFILFSYINNDLKGRLFLLIPLLGISGILEAASLALLIPLLSLILQSSNNNILVQYLGISAYSETEKILIIFFLFIITIIFKGIFVFFITRFTFFTSAYIKVTLQNKLFKKYLEKDFLSHLSSNSANYLRNITTECHQIEGRLIMPGLTLMAEILPVGFIVGFLIYLNPLGVLIAFIVFTFSGLLITKLTSKYLKMYGKEQIKSDGMQVKIAKEAFSSLKEISLYKKEEEISTIYNRYTQRSADLISNALALGQIPKFVLEVVGLLTISLIAYIGFSKGATANDVLIELAVFMGAIVKLLPSANRIVMNIQSLSHAKPAIENILKELKNSEYKRNKEDNSPITKFENIKFENLTFKYPAKNEYVIQNINFDVTRGEIIGIKGESGSGKSTFINLILGLFDSTEGRILINGVDIKECKQTWQEKISYVPQEVILFDDTLENNIAFYEDNIPREAIAEILKKLKLGWFTDNLDTLIGEGGSSLSGGQKQRIGIARALARNPEVIIFDEATSSLDNDTEEEINKLIKEISKTSTVFIIAHKKSALSICDKIYTMKEKHLVCEEI